MGILLAKNAKNVAARDGIMSMKRLAACKGEKIAIVTEIKMSWKITEHRSPDGQQELRLKALIREMAEYSYATYAEAFENHFKQLVKDIPRTNNYSADLLYRVTQRNLKSIEIWKMTVTGEFKYKMFTLDYLVERIF